MRTTSNLYNMKRQSEHPQDYLQTKEFSKTIENQTGKYNPNPKKYKKREKGPYYQAAMKKLGGVEDKVGEMEKSLRRYELRLSGNFAPETNRFSQFNEFYTRKETLYS